MLYGSENKRQRAIALRDEIVARADDVVVVNDSIKKYLGRGKIIHNAADDALAKLWKTEHDRDDKQFVIGILGTLNELCPLEPLLQAVTALVRSDSTATGRIRIRHVGHGDAGELGALAAQYGLEDVLELKGYQPRQNAITMLADADMLYLGVAGQGQYHIVPGRLFDYLISGKPILGMVATESETAHLIAQSGQGTTVAPDDVDGAAEFVKRCMTASNRETDTPSPDIGEFFASRLAEKYARVLDGVLGRTD